MTLTAKQEAFAQAIADGLNQSDAYRKAYDVEAMKPQSINRKAKELMDNGKITARIDELKGKLEAKALWTREMSVQTLIAVVQGSDKASDQIAAVKELNAMHGYQAPTKTETSITGGLTITKIELVPLK